MATPHPQCSRAIACPCYDAVAILACEDDLVVSVDSDPTPGSTAWMGCVLDPTQHVINGMRDIGA